MRGMKALMLAAISALCLTPKVFASDASGYAQTKGERAIYAPAVPYPMEARQARTCGSGVFVLLVDRRSGEVRNVLTAQSTGARILDESALATFISWKFDPRSLRKGDGQELARVRMPVSFVLGPEEEIPPGTGAT